MTLYTVQKGDSLWKIARRHQLGLDALIAANPQLSDPNSILVGQQINLPGPWMPAPGTAEAEAPDLPFCDRPQPGRPCIYAAAAGETLESIAQSFMIPLTQLIYFNLGYGKREPLPGGARVVIPGGCGETPHYPPHYLNGGEDAAPPSNGAVDAAASGSCPPPAAAPLPATEPWGASCGRKPGRRGHC